MDQAYELLSQGRVGMTTIMGMGGVFLALLCLYGFTTLLGALRSRRQAKPKDQPAAAQAGANPGNPGKAGSAGNEALAAAMAVAIAIQADSQRVLPLSVMSAPVGLSHWKTAGRRSLMRPPVRPARKRQ